MSPSLPWPSPATVNISATVSATATATVSATIPILFKSDHEGNSSLEHLSASLITILRGTDEADQIWKNYLRAC
jgi:hypothetical protein